MLCARYLVASDALERSGPIAAAVRAAGYVSEEEPEEEGSSVEEEQRDADDDEGTLPPGAYRDSHEADVDAEPPSYHPHPLLEFGQGGYLVRPYHLCLSYKQGQLLVTRPRAWAE